ncbi:MAG: hypothetical protein AAGB05_03790, partial [Pseudomonadota bacterium]
GTMMIKIVAISIPPATVVPIDCRRRDHLERTIAPALAAGRIVATDRFADSTRVYQGATRGDLRALVDALHDQLIGADPDLTFVIDMDPRIALSRGLARGSGEDRFEDMGLTFQYRLRDGFRALAAEAPDRVHLIEGDRPPDAVAADVARIMARILGISLGAPAGAP